MLVYWSTREHLALRCVVIRHSVVDLLGAGHAENTATLHVLLAHERRGLFVDLVGLSVDHPHQLRLHAGHVRCHLVLRRQLIRIYSLVH